MKYFYVLIMMAFLIPLYAEGAEVVESVTSSWQMIVTGIITAVILPLLAKFLYNKGQEHKAKAKAMDMENANTASMIKNEFLDVRLIPFLYEAGSNLTKDRLPAILSDVADSSNGFDWKSHALIIKEDLRTLAIAKFQKEGIDLINEYGSEYIDSLIDRAINKAMPFIPNFIGVSRDKIEGASKGVADAIITKGVDYANKIWNGGDNQL